MGAAPIRVLIADADAERAALLVRFLSAEPGVSFHVVRVARLADAVEALAGDPFDVILADLILEDSQGLPTLAILRTYAEGAPVILLSDRADDPTPLRALQHGAQDQLPRDQLYPMPVARAVRFAVERNRADVALRESEQRYRILFQQSRDAIYMADRRGRIMEVNPAALELFGYGEEEMIGRDIASLFADPLEYAQLEVEVARAGTVRGVEVRMRTRDGRQLWCLLAAAERRTAVGETLGLQGIIHDITDRKQAEARLEHDALHDALTDLPNRALFMDRLEQAVRRAEREPEPSFALLFLDLDRFKEINDTLGHAAGDAVLRRAAELLRSCVRAHDTVARLGGDEFVILLDGIASVTEARHVAERMIEVLGRPYRVRDRELRTTASIGMTWPTGGGSGPDALVREADVAMYEAKRRGGARIEMFSPDLRPAAEIRRPATGPEPRPPGRIAGYRRPDTGTRT
jgi:diguanylate cyclase (GGDEF)-like protein/PAS domain S-box-containing protein